MASKKMVGELIRLYYELDDTIESMAGNVDAGYITDLKNLQIRIDKLLTNISKRWSRGNRLRGYIPVEYIHDDDYLPVQVRFNTL